MTIMYKLNIKLRLIVNKIKKKKLDKIKSELSEIQYFAKDILKNQKNNSVLGTYNEVSEKIQNNSEDVLLLTKIIDPDNNRIENISDLRAVLNKINLKIDNQEKKIDEILQKIS